ncbi:leucine-rich repeat-containing protein 24-like, partial [Homarus americanus]|uniref:leucine-rich repeat-containing protein 24-like n=1 Tax=Homarus americanus TaxID=6706 RepID=UPI001C43F271
MSTTPGSRPSLCQPRRRAALLWAWLWALALTEFGALADCPKVCECKWRDGKEVVSCRDAHFIDIPRGLDPSTQVLDLRHNNLRILPRDSFVYTGLVNLQKVWLNFCNLMRLEKGAFRMLSNVVELDLSNNFLRTVPSEALMDMGGLRELHLAHNGLKVIPTMAFVPTPELVHLDISHNTISVIEDGALRTLSRLEVLNLSDNKLETMDASELIPLAVLRVIHLDGNPWYCDCRLRPLRKWMREHNLAASVPAVCSHPRWLTGRDWQLLDEEEFVCAPLVSAVAPRVLAAEGENVSLACRVESEVETIVTWLVGDSPLQNTSEAQRYTVVELMGPYYAPSISNLTITDVVPMDQGTYRCVAENRAGRREVNLTLQVSHEVAEVRVANVDDSYMKGGVLGGIIILVCILFIVCLLIYCKVRSSSRPLRQEDDKLVTPQTSRGSEGTEPHKLAGYHIVPTNDLEDPQPSARRSQQTQSSWMLHEATIDDYPPGKTLEKGGAEGHRQESVEIPVTLPTATPSSVSYVEIPKSGVGAVRTTLEDPARWKDHLIYHSRDAIFYRMCGRSSSQVSVGVSNSGQYPDLLDLPRSQLQQQQEMQQHYSSRLPLHTLNPSYCTLPRTRARVNSDVSTRPDREAGKSGLHTTTTQPAPPPPLQPDEWLIW